MELKPGYKQTEVGVIPEDWELTPLAKLYKFSNGVNADKAAYGKGMPFINVLEPITYSHIRGSEIPGLIELPSQVAAPYTVNHGDILFNRTSETDSELGMAAVYLGHERVVFGGFVIRAQPDNDAIDPIYAGYALRGEMVRAQIIPLGQGAVRANIGQESLRKVRALVPPKHEQHLIAEALQDIDNLLSEKDEFLRKKRNIKQAAMQELLTGKRRLPGFEGEWEVKTIAELEKMKLLRLGRGKVISKKDIENKPGDFPIYSSSIHNNGLFGRYGDFMFDEELITWSVDGGGNFFYRPKHKFSVTNVCGFIRVGTSQIDCRFLSAMLQMLHTRKNYDYQTKAHPSVIRKEYEVMLPSLHEQKAITSILQEIDEDLGQLARQHEKTRLLKQGMMQQLLTGKIRLK